MSPSLSFFSQCTKLEVPAVYQGFKIEHCIINASGRVASWRVQQRMACDAEGNSQVELALWLDEKTLSYPTRAPWDGAEEEAEGAFDLMGGVMAAGTKKRGRRQ